MYILFPKVETNMWKDEIEKEKERESMVMWERDVFLNNSDCFHVHMNMFLAVTCNTTSVLWLFWFNDGLCSCLFIPTLVFSSQSMLKRSIVWLEIKLKLKMTAICFELFLIIWFSLIVYQSINQSGIGFNCYWDIIYRYTIQSRANNLLNWSKGIDKTMRNL